jgi:hypothetical protein
MIATVGNKRTQAMTNDTQLLNDTDLETVSWRYPFPDSHQHY